MPKLARVLVKVFSRGELEWVYEEAGDDGVAFCTGAGYEREMARVEGSHGGDEGKGAGAAGKAACLIHGNDGGDDLHGVMTLRW